MIVCFFQSICVAFDDRLKRKQQEIFGGAGDFKAYKIYAYGIYEYVFRVVGIEEPCYIYIHLLQNRRMNGS